MTDLTFHVPQAMWMTANDHKLHWGEKARRAKFLRELGFVTARNERIPRLGTTHVAAYIGYLRNGRADPANERVTKHLIDGMVDAGVWADDDSTHVIGPTYLRGPKSDRAGHYCVRLVLTDQEVPWT